VAHTRPDGVGATDDDCFAGPEPAQLVRRAARQRVASGEDHRTAQRAGSDGIGPCVPGRDDDAARRGPAVRDGEGGGVLVGPRQLLVHDLRETRGLTGTNVGCDTTSCGACTVLLDGESVKSCTVLAVQADGGEVTTIEGLASGDAMHPVQEAFREHHGLQCGYCTPGMVMAAVSLLAEHPDPSEYEVRHGLEGNLCRCTGYHNIVQAVMAAARTH